MCICLGTCRFKDGCEASEGIGKSVQGKWSAPMHEGSATSLACIRA